MRSKVSKVTTRFWLDLTILAPKPVRFSAETRIVVHLRRQSIKLSHEEECSQQQGARCCIYHDITVELSDFNNLLQYSA